MRSITGKTVFLVYSAKKFIASSQIIFRTSMMERITVNGKYLLQNS